MAFWLTVIYVVLTYLSPEELFPGLSQYHPMLFLAVAASLMSCLPLLQHPGVLLRSRQTYLLAGLVVAVMASQVANSWLGGAWMGIQKFMPNAIVFFLIAVNVRSWRRVRIVTLALVVTAFVVLAEGVPQYYNPPPQVDQEDNSFVLSQHVWSNGQFYVLTRLRGPGALNDPNDFAQFLITILPFVFIAWQRGQMFRNLALVVFPSAPIFYGVFLTHSRGALIGIAVLFVISFRKKLGTIGSVATAAVMVLALMAEHFTGNRMISMTAGGERIEAWSAGLGMFKGSPWFGIGFNGFGEHYGLTAHNSFVLCAAELGLFGLSFWMALLVVTFFRLNALQRASLREPSLVSSADTDQAAVHYQAGSAEVATATAIETAVFEDTEQDQEELTQVRRWSRALILSFTAFVVTAWFLSRTYVVTLYLLIGLAVAVEGIAASAQLEIPRSGRNWVAVTGAATFTVLLLIYILARLHWA